MLQDLEKHRETASEYLKYFESTVLPSKTTDAPRGTRVQRVEVLPRPSLQMLQVRPVNVMPSLTKLVNAESLHRFGSNHAVRCHGVRQDSEYSSISRSSQDCN